MFYIYFSYTYFEYLVNTLDIYQDIQTLPCTYLKYVIVHHVALH